MRYSVDLGSCCLHAFAMPDTLPQGYSWRRATTADAEPIFTLISRCNTEVIGQGDVTLADIQGDLIEPGFTLETDSWLCHAQDGSLVGFAWAIGKGTGEQVDVDVMTCDDAVTPWMYDQVLARAAELARTGGHSSCAVDKGTYREDTRARAAAEERGFTPATVFHRMRVDHGPQVPSPEAPAGVTLRTGPGDEEFLRTAHSVLIESFRDHFGWFAKSFEDWRQWLDQDTTFDWSQLTVAWLDSRPVAILVANDRFVEDEKCGYVADIGVLPEARGRGIAKYLLRTAFAADIRAGRAGTILHVDTNNVTPALGLYESVGMRPVLVIDVWRRQLSTS